MLNRWRNNLVVPRATSPIKNIPMMAGGRPGVRRWNSTQGITSSATQASQRDRLQPPLWYDNSPLAALNDRYDTVRPEATTVSRPQMARKSITEMSTVVPKASSSGKGISRSSLRGLGRPMAIPSTSMSPENGSAALTYETNITPAQTVSRRPHGRGLGPKDGLVSPGFGRNGTYTDTSSRMLQYQSELDAESEDEVNTAFSEALGPWVSPLVDNSVVEEPEKTNSSFNMHEILHEIRQFQSNFVRKNQTLATEATSRTQRRALEYRDLHGDQGQRSPIPSRGAGQLLLFGNSLEYSIKIQNETILLEYTQIRLRFSSSLAEDGHENATMRSHSGVLGYIYRQKTQVASFLLLERAQAVYIPPTGTQTKLQRLWDEEMAVFRTQKDLSDPEIQPKDFKGTPEASGSGSHAGYLENGGVFPAVDFGTMARAVRLTPAEIR